MKKRWLLGCGCGVLALSALGALAVFVWPLVSAPMKPGPVVEVVTYYPGMPASSIEKTITNRIERWVNQAPGANEVTSRSLAGVSIVRITFRNDIDADAALTQVNQLTLATLPTLPPDTLPPVVLPRDPRSSEPLGVLGVSGTMVDDMVLWDLAKISIRTRLIGVPGAVAPVVLGGKDSKSAAPTVRFRIDGRPAVGVPVYLQRDALRRDVYNKLTDDLPSLRKEIEMREAQLRWVPLGAEHKWLREQDDGLLKIYLRAPSNVRLANTEKRVAAVEGFLEKSIPAKEREAIVSEVGMTPDWSAIFTANAGPMDATILVQLSRDRAQSAAAYAGKLRHLMRDDPSFADLDVRFASHDMATPANIRIEGGNKEEAMRLARDVRQQVATIKGMVDVDIAQRLDAPQLILSADSKKAAALGLSSREILSQVVAVLKSRAPLDGDFWTDVTTGDQSLTVPYSEELKAKLEDVLNVAVTGGHAEQPVKLGSLVSLQRTTTAVEIDHVSLRRVFDVRANIEGRDRGDVSADTRKMLQELKIPEGIEVKLVN